MSNPTSSVSCDPATRSDLYRLLALGFRYPTPDLFEALQTGAFAAKLWDRIGSLPHLRALATERTELNGPLMTDFAALSFGDFEVAYTRTFDTGAPEPPCPPYEGLHGDKERIATMLEISEFYRCFGLKMSQDSGKREMPDHICAELEFLHFLTFKETQARQEGNTDLLKGYLLAESDFLERHATRWMPNFSKKLERSGATPFHVALGRLVSTVVESELTWVESAMHEVDSNA